VFFFFFFWGILGIINIFKEIKKLAKSQKIIGKNILRSEKDLENLM